LVVGGVPTSAGDGAPHGMSPAKAETERTNVIAMVVNNFFMAVSPVGLTMQGFLHQID
jgi:hypothetical protein